MNLIQYNLSQKPLRLWYDEKRCALIGEFKTTYQSCIVFILFAGEQDRFGNVVDAAALRAVAEEWQQEQMSPVSAIVEEMF